MVEFSRRDVMRLLGMGAGAVAMGGPMAVGRALAQDRAKELSILCWEGYNSAQVLDPFRTDTAATVKAESATNDPTMINKLRAGETNVWDLINLNNAWARKVLFPEGLIKPLDRAEFEPYYEKMMNEFKAPYRWSMSDDGQNLIGMAQRFGPYSFVVNTDKISRATAEDQGWDLWNDKANAGKYGILESEDWNVFHTFMVAGINPFKQHDDAELKAFDEAVNRIYSGAKLIGDLATMNQAMVSGEIDFHLTGGNYSVSPARADGYLNLRGITPLRGAIDGKGGTSWVEITSLVNNPNISPLATDFLKYVQQPDVSHTVAFAEGTFNPVSQMGNPDCFNLFTPEELDIIQWDSLGEEMSRSAEYDIVPDYDVAVEMLNAAKRARG